MKSKRMLLVVVVLMSGAGAITLSRIRGCDSKGRSVASAYRTSKAREQDKSFSHVEKEQRSLEALLDSYKHPIALYGKIVDQFDEAVPGATVEIFVHSEYFGDKSGAGTMLKTDKEGKFSIEGLIGNAIGATASKEGYLGIPPLSPTSSSASLTYSGGYGTGDQHSHPSNPVVLTLLKIGATQPMVHIDKKRWRMPLDGTPQIIALDSKEGQGIHQIDFRFASNWNELPMDNEINSKLFDWSFELHVPGGGFIWDETDLEFEAPVSGYEEVVRYEYTATMPRDQWKRVQRGRYFVRFSDNSYGRIQFEIDGASDRMPLRLESWLCLTPDSRNLATENMIISVIGGPESGR